MFKDTISKETARNVYDRLGSSYDWAERYEGRAKSQALTLLDLHPGQRILNIGVGSGRQHLKIQSAVLPGGTAVGLDLSPVMLNLTRQRTHAPLSQADARQLPFASASFDRIFLAYVLDLLPTRVFPSLLADFGRILKPEGRLVIVSLTEGDTLPSRLLVGLWKMIYTVSPTICGGCRPLQLVNLVQQAGFKQVKREVVVQLAVPSEIIVATP